MESTALHGKRSTKRGFTLRQTPKMRNPGPFHLCFLFFLPLLALCDNPTLDDDVLGLIVFKADLHDPRAHLSSWTEDDDHPCNWTSVKCDPRTNRVAELSLDSLSLSGKISARGLLRLPSLRRLSLSANHFSGPLSSTLLQLPSLKTLDLSANNLSGSIPDDFFTQCRAIRSIALAENAFSGEIPSNIGSCSTLAALNLSSNQLSGALPSGLWSLNALRSLDLSDNALTGEIPLGVQRMYNLRAISLRANRLSGRLPEDIGGCSLLKSIDFSENLLSGKLPESMRMLSLCGYLRLGSNSFSGEVPAWTGEMGMLEVFDLSGNGLSGTIPDSISNLELLKELNLSRNGLTGSLPESMAVCKSLESVDFSWNSLNGSIPTWVFKSGLQRILVSKNKLSGLLTIPRVDHSTLRLLDLSANAFAGAIPVEISSIQSLQFLNLSSNSFLGSIPASIGELKLLEVIDLSGNRLNGSIPPEIGRAAALKELRVEKNKLGAGIPGQLGNCSLLTFLDLSENNLTGSLPATMAKLTSLETIDLSRNKLSGALPKELSELPHLISFNISHNFFSGDLPSGNFFDTIPLSSLSDNPGLCGSILNRTCPAVLPKPIVLNPNSSSSTASSDPALRPESLRHKIILSISALIAIGAAALITVGVIAITVLNLRVRSSASRSAAALALSDDYLSQSPTTDAHSGKLVMFSANDAEFSTSAHAVLNKDCELGRGGFGTVYKTILHDGRPVAIKKLTVSSLVKSQEDFEREVKKLGKVRHPNLIALEGYYWTSSLQLLIYEFVSGGNLYKHLHECSQSNALSWRERFNIILGTARSLAHLHGLKIIHYNLKSSNVLIDASGKAKVGDYGLAKLLPMLDRYVLSSKIQSALGYMAPEFACKTVKVTEKCDVYAFGVLVLEVVTGRRPVEYMEDDVVVLCDVMRRALEDGRVEECMDGGLRGAFPVDEAIPVVKLGLICTSQVPSNRPGMTEVVNILELIKCPQESQEEEIS